MKNVLHSIVIFPAAVLAMSITGCVSQPQQRPAATAVPKIANKSGYQEYDASYYNVSYGGQRVGRMGYPGFVEFYDSKGRTIAQLFAGTGSSQDEPSLTLSSVKSGNQVRISQVGGAEGPQVFMNGANGYPRMWLRGTSNGTELKMADDIGRVRLHITTDRNGGRIEFVDEHGRVVKSISQ
jgi:hypothetical protein